MTDLIEATADISDDGVYRYELVRRWSDTPMALWVMLNPSTADADVDDNTIRRCMGFARNWGCGGIRVVNLFALRATDPKELKRHPAPIGVRNATAIADAIHDPDTSFIVAAWGASNPYPSCPTIRTVRTHAKRADRPLFCLGTTALGSPRHPLYIAGRVPLEIWR